MTRSLAIHRSRALIPPFCLHRPSSISEACALMRDLGASAKFMAGGIDVVSRMKYGECVVQKVEHVIALTRIAQMREVRLDGDALHIGAATTHRDIETDSAVRAACPWLRDYVRDLGNIRIRFQGTIGGNVMANEPGYEIVPALVAADASLYFAGVDGGTVVTARDFARDEKTDRFGLLTHVVIPASSLVAWDRSLRPLLSVVASQSAEPVAALVGAHRRPVWSSIPRGAGPRDGESVARQWSDTLPPANFAGGPSVAYARRVAAVLLDRLLARSKATAA